MSSKGIRLRLVIRRHAVPEVRLVWPCNTSEDLTIAKLLTQVNEVVPLESSEWGLEDYAVELSDEKGGSFECLHFQQVAQIFKEDDQVIIRSLLTEDLRRRRLSGRHQISSDGKHLIDGLAFGRPWLRVPRDRPALDLPPRKRARITHQEAEDDEAEDPSFQEEEPLRLEAPESFQVNPGRVAFHAMFDDADREADNEQDEGADSEGDFEPAKDAESSADEEEDINLEDEIRLLQEDNAVIGENPSTERLEFYSEPDEEPLRGLLSAQDIDLSSLDHITALRSAFPLTSISAIHSELVSQNKNLRETYQALARSNEPIMSFDEMMDQALTGFGDFAQPGLLRQETSILSGLGSQDSDSVLRAPTRPLIQEVESIDNPTSGGDSEDTSSSGSSSESDSDSDSSSEGESDEGTEDSDSSDSDSSDSDSDSDSSEDDSFKGNSADNPRGKGSSESSSEDSSDDSSSSDDSDSESESDSEPEEIPSRPTVPNGYAVPEPIKKILTAPASPAPDTPVPPGCGSSKTQKRNARRRETKRIKKSESTESEPQTYSNTLLIGDQELLARKRALLGELAELTPPEKSTPPLIQEIEEEVQPEEAQPEVETAEKTNNATPDPESSPRRRAKVDVGAGRRLLFGALGLKAPKSKADEDKLRKNLMKDVKPLENHRTKDSQTNNDKDAEAEKVDEDPDAWREKIKYRAVECCHEGMVLSGPPFPFVQRWDPQQQYGSMRKRKRQSQNYDESYYDESYYDNSYYDENSQWNEDGGEWEESSQKKKKKKSKKGKAKETEDNENVELNYDDAPAVAQQESSPLGDDDLPALPEDVTALPRLEFGDIKPGMVITWSQLLMSKATRWQPQNVSLTGLVLSISDDESLHVLLAKRDRQENDKEYDDDGKRIYEKFEAPDLDEDEEDEDDGRRDVFRYELGEPRLLQSTSVPNSSSNMPAKGVVPPVEDALMKESGAEKVSKKQESDKNMAEELDLQEVMAGDPEPRGPEAGEPAESDKSTSIPSRQIPPSSELTTSNDSAPHGAMQTNTPSDMIDSPKRQLQEPSHTAVALGSTALQQSKTKPDEDESDNRTPNRDEMDAEMEDFSSAPLADSILDSVIPDSLPSYDFPSQRSADDFALSQFNAGQQNQAGPPSVTSIHSGRQPPSNFGLSSHEEVVQDSEMADATPRAQATPPAEENKAAEDDDSSSSPFPTLEEIFHTAETSRQTQSPFKSSQLSGIKSLKVSVKKDLEYEEAMRKLDEDEESEDTSNKNKSIRKLFPNATQPSGSEDVPKSLIPKVETPKKSTPSRRSKRGSPFVIPEGSQVISLSSSPGSSQFAEDYAQDSEDDSYKESQANVSNSSPKSNAVTRRETRSRVKSVPATSSVPRRTRGTRSRTSLPPALNTRASAFSQIKGRKKSSRK